MLNRPADLASHALWDHVRQLAEVIGPRPSASPREARAGDYIERTLSGLGWRFERQDFRSVTSFSWAVLIVFGLCLVAAGLVRACPAAALGVSLAALVMLVLEASTVSTVTRLLPVRPSRNLFAAPPAGPTPGGPSAPDRLLEPGPATAGPLGRGRPPGRGGPLRRLTVVAHYDSSREAVLYHPLLVPAFRALFLLMVAAAVIIAAFSLLTLCLPGLGAALAVPAWVAGGYLAVMFLVLVHRETLGRHVAGANDNASGVAVALGLAARLAQAPTGRLQVNLLFTGAEEAGTVGMLSFLARHGQKIKAGPATAFLNLDNLGRGSLRYISGEGMLNVTRSDPELVRAAAAVAAERPDLGLAPAVYQSLTTDSLAAMMRGFRAMGVMAFDARGTLPNWHWRTDTVDRVDPANLDRALEFVEGLIRHLDRDQPPADVGR